tara:strand:- start:12040 stop:13059 length:1020 start_codon:yes stop_codon:yes gene_type:complete
MLINLFLSIFFKAPAWLIRIFTLKKQIHLDGQSLDYKSQIFIGFIERYRYKLGGDELDYVALREGRANDSVYQHLSAQPISKINFKDHTINLTDRNLTIREYTPASVHTNRPILYFHGGGYVLGDLETHHGWLKYFSSKSGFKIFSVEYRLSPENPFPSALEDANESLDWLSKNFKIDVKDIILCGDSAGAHLAASLSTHRSLNHLELPKSQFLIYPMINPLCDSDSLKYYSSGFLLTAESMQWFWSLFQSNDQDISDPRFNLNIDPKVKDFPDTLMVTAGFDPLRDEGEIYANNLLQNNFVIEQLHYPNMFHAFVNMTRIKACKIAADDMINELKEFI